MHIVALIVLAAVLGAVYTFVQGPIQGFLNKLLPASTQGSKVVSALSVGVIILIALFLADIVVGAVGMRGRRA